MHVAGCGGRDEGRALLGGPRERLLEQLIHPPPACGVDRAGLGHASPPCSARSSQAFANVQWRLTVAGDTPRTSAVSSTDNPPK